MGVRSQWQCDWSPPRKSAENHTTMVTWRVQPLAPPGTSPHFPAQSRRGAELPRRLWAGNPGWPIELNLGGIWDEGRKAEKLGRSFPQKLTRIHRSIDWACARPTATAIGNLVRMTGLLPRRRTAGWISRPHCHPASKVLSEAVVDLESDGI